MKTLDLTRAAASKPSLDDDELRAKLGRLRKRVREAQDTQALKSVMLGIIDLLGDEL